MRHKSNNDYLLLQATTICLLLFFIGVLVPLRLYDYLFALNSNDQRQ